MTLHYRSSNNSAAHESLRAIGRCLMAHFGDAPGRRYLENVVRIVGVGTISRLTEREAEAARKFLEPLLPDCLA